MEARERFEDWIETEEGRRTHASAVANERLGDVSAALRSAFYAGWREGRGEQVRQALSATATSNIAGIIGRWPGDETDEQVQQAQDAVEGTQP